MGGGEGEEDKEEREAGVGGEESGWGRGRVEEEELHVFFCLPLKVSPVDSGADIKAAPQESADLGSFDEDPLTSEIITLLLRNLKPKPLPPTHFTAAPSSPFTFTESGTGLQD